MSRLRLHTLPRLKRFSSERPRCVALPITGRRCRGAWGVETKLFCVEDCVEPDDDGEDELDACLTIICWASMLVAFIVVTFASLRRLAKPIGCTLPGEGGRVDPLDELGRHRKAVCIARRIERGDAEMMPMVSLPSTCQRS